MSAFATASWPGLTRPSTSSAPQLRKVVDARHKAGHDDDVALSSMLARQLPRQRPLPPPPASDFSRIADRVAPKVSASGSILR